MVKNVYAGFWLRLVAVFIDGIIITIGVLAIASLAALLTALGGSRGTSAIGVAVVIGYIAGIIVPWLYYAKMESSTKQATLGKMAVGIIVTDMQGRRISFWRATGRYFGKYISQTILYIGYIMIAFTKQKQGLHDIIAGCLVVKNK